MSPGNKAQAAPQSARSSFCTFPTREERFTPALWRHDGSYSTPYGGSVTIRDGLASPGLCTELAKYRASEKTSLSENRATSAAVGDVQRCSSKCWQHRPKPASRRPWRTALDWVAGGGSDTGFQPSPVGPDGHTALSGRQNSKISRPAVQWSAESSNPGFGIEPRLRQYLPRHDPAASGLPSSPINASIC